MPQSLCLTTALALSVPSSPTTTSNASGRVAPTQRQVALDAEPAAVGRGAHAASSGR